MTLNRPRFFRRLILWLAGSLVAAAALQALPAIGQDYTYPLPQFIASPADAPPPFTPGEIEYQRLPPTELEARVQQLEEIIHQQARRQQELEQELLQTSSGGVYGMPGKTPTGASPDRPLVMPPKTPKGADPVHKAEDAPSTKPTLKLAGRIHADYWAFPGTDAGANAFETGDATDSVDDRFLFRRVRLQFAGDVPDNMRYMLQLDFNTPNSPQFKDVYLAWDDLPVLQTLQVGMQKRPYGLDHISSSNNNIFLERPFIVEAFNQDTRRFGVCAYGESEDLAWNWRYGAFMQQDMQNIGTAFATPIDEDYQAEVAARLANTIWYDESSDGRGYAHWAIAGAVASPDGDAGANSTARFQTRPEARTSDRWLDTGVITGAETYELLALEGVLNLGAVQVVGEYQNVWMQRRAGFEDVDFDGGYVYASYFLTGEHMVWDRETGQLGRMKPLENFFCVRDCDGNIGKGWGAWQVAARYSHGDFTDQDIFGGVGDALTLGLVWWWNPHARMQFNYIYGEIDQHDPIDGQTSANYHILGTRFHVDF